MSDSGEGITHRCSAGPAETSESMNEGVTNENIAKVERLTQSMEVNVNDTDDMSDRTDVNKEEQISSTERALSPETDNRMDDDSLSQGDNESQGDCNAESANKQTIILETVCGGEQLGEEETTETTTLVSENQDEQMDGLHVQLEDVQQTETEKDSTPPDDEKCTAEKFSPQETSSRNDLEKPRLDVENIGFIAQQLTASQPDCNRALFLDDSKVTTPERPEEPIRDPYEVPTPKPPEEPIAQKKSGTKIYLLAMGLIAIVAILVQQLQPEASPQKNNVQPHIDVFLKQMEKVQTLFPNQRVELWKRSRIHLQRHLQTAQPTEPVSLILTAGLSAQKTLRCLAKTLASAFSSAHNASILLIDGAAMTSQDSDQVKLDIDSKLQAAFEGNTPVAVIHRFEELPPGSTLIFYRYCDHENAAYKKTFLIFTVLLGEEEIPAKIHLRAVEEMVDDHLQRKFLSHGRPASFDRMDRDKYGGLWSRISHLILPVATEERIEQEGCERTQGDAHL